MPFEQGRRHPLTCEEGGGRQSHKSTADNNDVTDDIRFFTFCHTVTLAPYGTGGTGQKNTTSNCATNTLRMMLTGNSMA